MKIDKLVAQLIAAELRAAGARSDLIDLAALLVEQAVKVTEVDGEAVLNIVDENGNPRIGDLAGNPMNLRAFIAELRTGRRAFMFDKAPKVSTPENIEDDRPEPPKSEETATQAMARRAREAAHAEKEAANRERNSWPNPWARGSENITRQMVLQNVDPARARAARAAAGVA